MLLAGIKYYDAATLLCLAAGIIYGIKYKRLEGVERLIVVILFANILTDALGFYLIRQQIATHMLYNILLPLERILTLVIYAFNDEGRFRQRLYSFAMVMVLIAAIAEFAYHGQLVAIHNLSNIFTGLLLAIFSYVHLRSMMLNTAGQSFVLFYFSLANLIYFTLMISAVSAVPLAHSIDKRFALKLFNINLVGYALWSALLIIGILWKRPRI